MCLGLIQLNVSRNTITYKNNKEYKLVKCMSFPKLPIEFLRRCHAINGSVWHGLKCSLRRSDSGAPQHLAALSGVTNSPGIVLEDLPRVCEETGSELWSLHIASLRTDRAQVGFAGVFLGPGRATGRRHVVTDVPEGGGASLCAAFSENRLLDSPNLHFKAPSHVLLSDAWN